jgi:hypothetical protein
LNHFQAVERASESPTGDLRNARAAGELRTAAAMLVELTISFLLPMTLSQRPDDVFQDASGARIVL